MPAEPGRAGGGEPAGQVARKPLSWRYNKMAMASGSHRDIEEYQQWAWDEARAVGQERRRRTWYYRCGCCDSSGRDAGLRDTAISLRRTCREGRAIAASDMRVPGDNVKYAGVSNFCSLRVIYVPSEVILTGRTEKGPLGLYSGRVWDHPSSGKNQGKLRANQPQLTAAQE